MSPVKVESEGHGQGASEGGRGNEPRVAVGHGGRLEPLTVLLWW